jgi:FSR family fosmidomycin resistance protein-like MFS transporter
MKPPEERTVFGILLSICACHTINDMLQSLLAAIYPTLKASFHLTFTQVGLVTLCYQLTASILQPLVGLYADRRSTPFSLPFGSLFTFAGLVTLALAPSYLALLTGASVLGIGSSIFHPESSRVARMAAGSRPGLAQSLFQVGGSCGGALGALGAAIVVAHGGQRALGMFAFLALVSTAILTVVSAWVRRHGLRRLSTGTSRPSLEVAQSARPGVTRPLAILLVLVFSKFVYLASVTSYYTFYLMHRFGVTVRDAQVLLFAALAAVAVGTLAGGWLGDRFGRKHVIWFSIVGALPFAIVLPHANLFWTGALTTIVGFVLASAFPAMVVYGQELIPNRIGLVSGLFFGLSFGAGGIGAAGLGVLADSVGIDRVYQLCSVLPALGAFAAFLPELGGRRAPQRPGGSRRPPPHVDRPGGANPGVS